MDKSKLVKVIARLSELHNLDKIESVLKHLPRSGAAICGGVAISYYTNGVRDPSPDLDLVVLPTAYRRMEDAFAKIPGAKEKSNALGFTITGPGIEVDVLKAQYAFLQDGIKQAQHAAMKPAPILPIEHLLLMKLDAGRDKDMEDAKMLCKQHPDLADKATKLNSKFEVFEEQELQTLLFLLHH